MPTYIALIDFTEQGIRSVQDSPSRAAALVENASKMGVTVKDVYWTTGDHDGVLILEAPDAAAVARLLLSLGRQGNVRTRTLRAFDRSEMKSILAKLG